MMPVGKVFLNYRREDSEGYVGRLYDHLTQRFPGRIFRDVTELRPGEDFVDALEREGLSCQVLLAVIGRHWFTIADASGQRRLDDPNDILRQEIVHALRRNILVIPVLVGGANMPPIEKLPADLAPLGRRQALPITELDFAHDLERLIGVLAPALGEPAAEKQPSHKPTENELNGLLSRARSAIAAQDWNAAIPALQSAVALNSADAEIAGQLQFALRQNELATLFGRGQVLYQNKDYRGALACFQQVRVLGGNYKDVDSLITMIQLGPRPIEHPKPKRLRWIVGSVLATIVLLAIVGIFNQEQQPKPKVTIVDGPNATPPVNVQPTAPPAAPSTSHITLRYLGDQLGGCTLRVNFNIGGKLIVPNSNPYYASDVPEGNQNYITTGAVVCPLGTCQAYGQGSLFIHEDSIFNIVWQQNSYTTCAMTLVPVQ
jgi:tetratricopeptide (TPR) repeat protein